MQKNALCAACIALQHHPVSTGDRARALQLSGYRCHCSRVLLLQLSQKRRHALKVREEILRAIVLRAAMVFTAVERTHKQGAARSPTASSRVMRT